MNTNTLNELFTYNPETGLIYWKAKGKGRIKKKEAGTLLHSGYIGICIGNRRVQAHRIAWTLFHGTKPKNQIDHINGIKTDNKIKNLREASNSQNGKNLKLSKANKSGIKGVCFEKYTNLYKAYIRVDGKMLSLGRYKTLQEAEAIRKQAEIKHFGEWNRT